MGKKLNDSDVERYREEGILFPLSAIGDADAERARTRLEALAASEGGKLSRSTNHKPHMLLPWLAELIRDPRVLDPVEDVLGPDILCWGLRLFLEAGQRPGLHLLAPGFNLLGAEPRRHRHRLGRLHAFHSRKRLHAGRAGHPQA